MIFYFTDYASGTENDVKLRDNFALRSVQSAGRALKTAGDRIPAERKLELEAIIIQHYQVLWLFTKGKWY